MKLRTLVVALVTLLSCGMPMSMDDGGAGGGAATGGGATGGGSATGGGGSTGGGATGGGATGGGATGGGATGGGATGGGATGGGATGGGGGMTVSFSATVAPIFRAKCQQACHGGAYQGTTMQIYSRLRGTTPGTTACANQPRLVVNDSANSLVVKKLLGTQTCGSKMPLVPMGTSSRDCMGTECVASMDLDLIRAWIDQGALNN
jgi:hypothetical protein